ncbi:EAL domain-containing protein [Leucothrix arctica]|nr:EAL domain-containing protein [Leucothrix arctica]
MTTHEQKIIEEQAYGVADIVAHQAITGRYFYGKNVLSISREIKAKIIKSDKDFHDKVGSNVLTPAQFLKGMAKTASEASDGLYKYRAVSKWNIAPDQGLDNEFLRFAWAELEKQDQLNPTKVIDWKPIFKVQEFEGKDTLLYLRPDPAVANSCVSCHNIYEQKSETIERRIQQNVAPRKVFKQHQLMGGIFVQIPVDKMQQVSAHQSKIVITMILGMLTIGLIGLTLFFSRDIIRARGIRKQLFWQAKHDSLTRLPNRISFEQKVALLVEDAVAEDSSHALFFLDLDQFKLVNDTCGHAAGDEVLCQVSKRLESSLKQNDFLARLGGDEFGVLLSNCDAKKAQRVAERLCKKIKDYKFIKNEHFFDIGVSIGAVIINQQTHSVEKVMRQADLACYAAKDAGKNRVRIYQDSDEALNQRRGEASWVSEILKALGDGRIVIYSQRIGAMSATSEHTHHEILVRLIDQQGEIICPEKFLPAAERYQLMPKLDLEIIEQSFAALQSGYFSDLGEEGFISINLSGQSLSVGDFLVTVKALISSYKVDPKKICFEITESSAIANQVRVREFILEMRALNVKFALDDFGTGLSSLTYLKDFPVDYLKIDGSFIKDIVTDSTDRSLVDAINQMAHTLGLKTIAEYVESKEIFNMLDTMKIDYAQGYFIQEPRLVDVKK